PRGARKERQGDPPLPEIRLSALRPPSALLRGSRPRAALREADRPEAAGPRGAPAIFPPNDGVHLRARMRDDGARLGEPVMAARPGPRVQALARSNDDLHELRPWRLRPLWPRPGAAPARPRSRNSREPRRPVLPRHRAQRGPASGDAGDTGRVSPRGG